MESNYCVPSYSCTLIFRAHIIDSGGTGLLKAFGGKGLSSLIEALKVVVPL